MTIVLPLFFAAIGVGLCARRITPAVWAGLCAWIALIIAYQFFTG